MNIAETDNITAVILAGGCGSRLGGQDKGLLEFAGRPIIEHILEAISPQAGAVIINANRNLEDYSKYGHPVISDEMDNYQGPLAGFAAALAACSTDYILTLPCDCPFVPADLIARMSRAMLEQHAELAVAHDGQRMQPVYALIPRTLETSLLQFLDSGERKIDRWYTLHTTALADFSDVADTFFNINTDDDRRLADSRRNRP